MLKFSIITVVLVVGIYFFSNWLINTTNEDGIFIWGDSQIFQGLNSKILEQETNLNVNIAARHGAGVYDFLIFSERVPENSLVLLSISKLAQVRRKNRDWNRSGININSLFTLYKHNYSLNEIWEIIKLNKRPKRLWKEEVRLYANNDKHLENPPIKQFKEYYKKIPYFLKDKQDLFLLGINKLREKNCKVIFLEYPFHKEIQIIEENSPIYEETSNFKKELLNKGYINDIDTLFLMDKSNIMYDYTHLNEYGANQVSFQMAEIINDETFSKLFIVKLKK